MALYDFASLPAVPVWVEPVTPPVNASHTIQQSSGVVLADGRVLHVWTETKTSGVDSGYVLLGYSPDLATYRSANNSVLLDRVLVANTESNNGRHDVWANVSRGPDGALWLIHLCCGGDSAGDWSATVTYDASMSAPPLPYTSRSMIWRSTDEGATWTYTADFPQTVSLINGNFQPGRWAVAGGIDVIPAGFPNAGRWLCTAPSANNYFGAMVWSGAIYTSDDNGATWGRKLAHTDGSEAVYHSAGSYGFGSDGNIYAGVMSNVLILGQETMWWRSADGGDTWAEYQTWYPTPNPSDLNCGAGPWLTIGVANRLAAVVPEVAAASTVRFRENDLTVNPLPLWDEAGTLPGADTYAMFYDSGLSGNGGLVLQHMGAAVAGLWRENQFLSFDLVAPDPWQPSTGIGGCTLGVKQHRVVFSYRGGRRNLGTLNDAQIMSLSYGRVLDDTSDASLDVAIPAGDPACCQMIGALRSWGHELHILRDDVEVWCGPVTDIVLRRESATILASDVTAWCDVRRVHNLIDLAGVDLTDIAVALLSDGLGVDDPNVLPYLATTLSGLVGDRLFDPGSNVGEALRELARTGLDFTALGRRIVIDGEQIDTKPLATLTQEAFLSDLELHERGDQTGTDWEVTGSGFTGTASVTDAFYGIIERVADEPTIRDQGSADAAAATRLAATYPAATYLVVPDGAQLAPSAPVSFAQLVPGALAMISVSDFCREIHQVMRLQQVQVTHTPNDPDVVAVTFAPIGSIPAGASM